MAARRLRLSRSLLLVVFPPAGKADGSLMDSGKGGSPDGGSSDGSSSGADSGVCTSNANCSANTPVCIPATSQCGCSDTKQCPSGHICDTVNYSSGQCVPPCTATGFAACDPDGFSPYCVTMSGSPESGLCVPCLDDSQCTSLGLGNYCTTEGCVSCLTNADCSADAGTPICINTCVQCGVPSDCPMGNGCNSATNQCGSCTVTSDCTSPQACTKSGVCGSVCVTGQSMAGCAPCVLNTDCPSSNPYCELDGICGSTANDGGVPDKGPCGDPCGTNSVCNPASGKCVGCLADSDCAHQAGTPKCDTSSKTCVECLSATDCAYSAAGCNMGYCGSCTTTADCPANNTCNTDTGECDCSGNSGCGGNAPKCLANHGCGCVTSADCGSGLLCDTVRNPNGACVANCTTPAGKCQSNGLAPYCDANSGSATYGLCLACLNDNQCAAVGTAPYCTALGCVSCRTDSDCMGSTPYCGPLGACVECASAADCTGSAVGCNSVVFQCGSCSVASDCPSGDVCNAGACGS